MSKKPTNKKPDTAKAQAQGKRKGSRAAAAKAATTRPRFGVSIRMYRLGVGDCFLVTLRKAKGAPFRMLIDCGVHQSQSGGGDRIKAIVANLREETGGKLDVVVATHEHWDHISGFAQAEEEFLKFNVGEVWVAWTEDSADELARSLKDKRDRALAALGMAESRFRLAAREDGGNPLSGLLGFFGDTTGVKLGKAAKVLKELGKDGRSIRYRTPGEAPIELDGFNARIFVLGPPRDKAAIQRSAPRKGESEVYAFGAYGDELDAIEAALLKGSTVPFDTRYSIPLEGTKSLSFFQKTYWADRSTDTPRKREDHSQEWRRIDEDWLDAATSLGLKLDEDTNNTSLVLALELGPADSGGPVLLFAADAQVGNWLSWQKVAWDYKGRRVTGPDLLRRTILYKVGHHASHNATLSKLGLELMETLELALVPTDDEMAKKVGWGTLPWPKLLTRLEEKTQGRVIRTDRPLPESAADLNIEPHDLFYQIDL